MDGQLGNAKRWPPWAALGALLMAGTTGCASVNTPVVPPITAPQQDFGLTLSPARLVAPIGSEVVMVAGVRGPGGGMLPGGRVEWMLAPDGVGQFVTAGGIGPPPGRGFWQTAPGGPFNRKIDNSYAVSTTTSAPLLLMRGTRTPADDVHVQPGETWMRITSPTSGTSHVTAYTVALPGWHRRHETARIYWVDAQFTFPPPAIQRAGGSHLLTTAVTRQSDQSPLPGWIVRYEIAAGPAAGLGAENQQVVEVVTDAAGQANVEISQYAAAAGTNAINIQVIHPIDPRVGIHQPFAASSGATQVTWSSPDLAIRTSGPAVSTVGAEATYKIEVVNAGDSPAGDVTVTDEIPPGMNHLGSNPTPELVEGRRTWRLGDLQPGQSQTIEVTVRTEQPGAINYCAAAQSAEGLAARSCAATEVSAAPPPPAAKIEVEVFGPAQAKVGDEVYYEIVISNRGEGQATGLRIADHFDPGLSHPEKSRVIEQRELVDLEPGQQTRVGVTFTVVEPGTHCHRVEVKGAGGVDVSKRVCVTATRPAAPPKPDASIRVTPPAAARVGEEATFTVEVVNAGTAPLSGVKLSVAADRVLAPARATRGYAFPDSGEMIWTLGRLAPGETRQVKIAYACRGAAEEACVEASLSSAEVAQRRGRACIRVAAAEAAPPELKPAGKSPAGKSPTGKLPAGKSPAGEMSVKVAETTSPLAVGRDTTYVITLTNLSPFPQTEVRLSATVPPEMVLKSFRGLSKAAATGDTVTFEPLRELRPQEEVAYQVTATARQTGTVRLEVEVRSDQLRQPIHAGKDTRIFQER